MKRSRRSMAAALLLLVLLTCSALAQEGPAIDSDTALYQAIARLAAQKTDSIELRTVPGYRPADISTPLWRNGVESYSSSISDGMIRITEIRYYDSFSVCTDQGLLDRALLRYARNETTDFRLFLSDRLADALLRDPTAVLADWKAKLQAESWSLYWNDASRQLHVSNVIYQSAYVPTPTVITATTDSPVIVPSPAPLPAVQAGSQGSPDQPLQTRDSFIQALSRHAEALDTEFELHLSPGLMSDVIANIDGWVSELRANEGIISYSYHYNEHSGLFRLSEIRYRTAVRIWNCYRQEKTQQLDPKEQQTLQVALRIVSSAPSELLVREQYIHDHICNTVTYFSTDDEGYDEKDQAVGALLNGQADCDGYSEAFYLLSNLAGIPARFQHGDTIEKSERTEITHMWNLVMIGETWLMVDVTWDDTDRAGLCTYLYYNIGTKRAAESHTWDDSVLTVPWVAEGGNSFRPAALAEATAAGMQDVTALIRQAFIDQHRDRLAIYTPGLDPEAEKELISDCIYSTGVKDYVWSFGAHSVEIIPLEWYSEYRIVADELQALSYIQEMKRSGKTEFVLFFTGDYGAWLFADDLARFRLLEGQFGMDQQEMTYSDASYKVSYTHVSFMPEFRICRSTEEISRYIDELAARQVTDFSFCVPGETGHALLENQLEQLNSVLNATLLKSDRKLTYYTSTQQVTIREAHYWPGYDRCNFFLLDDTMRSLLFDRPESLALWTDGSYRWDDAHFRELSTALYRQGVDSFRYQLSEQRIEFNVLTYVPEFRLVNSENELLAYLQECRSLNKPSFCVYCTFSLYKNLSANRFSHFFDLTSSILRDGQSISYQDEYYTIGMDSVRYVK